MARTSTDMPAEFVFATLGNGLEIEIFKREATSDIDAVIHRTVDTIVDLGVKEGAPQDALRSRVLVTSFNLMGKKSVQPFDVRETPKELITILGPFDVEPEIWENNGSVDGLVARITGRRRRGAEAHI